MTQSVPHPVPRPAPVTGHDTTPDRDGEPPRFTGAAAPYAGGDPYADYRTGPLSFTHHPDLAGRGLGGAVIAASDEFFADRENLLHEARPVFDPARFGSKGKVMDGWETRRRRGPSATEPWPGEAEHDWALVRLGVPGVVHGIVADTAHFRGNHPQAVSVEGTCAEGTPAPEDLLGADVRWHPLVPRTPVGGHAANGFAVRLPRRLTHLRVRQYPDGGLARLRVYGEPVPDPGWLTALGTFDVVALEHGGRVEDASDRFYSPPEHTIFPGLARRMDDGWETRRRRDHGHDWITYRLAAHAEIRAVEIDTAYLKGNAAGWASLSLATTAADGAPGPGSGPEGWTEALPPTRLQPDSVHRFVLATPLTADHARLDIRPDGGVSRLRLYGSLTDRGRRELLQRHRELG